MTSVLLWFGIVIETWIIWVFNVALPNIAWYLIIYFSYVKTQTTINSIVTWRYTICNRISMKRLEMSLNSMLYIISVFYYLMSHHWIVRVGMGGGLYSPQTHFKFGFCLVDGNRYSQIFFFSLILRETKTIFFLSIMLNHLIVTGLGLSLSQTSFNVSAFILFCVECSR